MAAVSKKASPIQKVDAPKVQKSDAADRNVIVYVCSHCKGLSPEDRGKGEHCNCINLDMRRHLGSAKTTPKATPSTQTPKRAEKSLGGTLKILEDTKKALEASKIRDL